MVGVIICSNTLHNLLQFAPCQVPNNCEQLEYKSEVELWASSYKMAKFMRKSKNYSLNWPDANGGADRDRTCDLLIANETLYQLSYDPNASG